MKSRTVPESKSQFFCHIHGRPPRRGLCVIPRFFCYTWLAQVKLLEALQVLRQWTQTHRQTHLNQTKPGCECWKTGKKSVNSSAKSRISGMRRKGSYILYLHVRRPLTLNVGMLRSSFFPAGCYLYVGSAAAGITRRLARHRRLALQKEGKTHWHIDYLLIHPDVNLTAIRALEKSSECEISKQIASRKGITVPVLNFGSTDCLAGCKAHLYRIHTQAALRNKAKRNPFAASADGAGSPPGHGRI